MKTRITLFSIFQSRKHTAIFRGIFFFNICFILLSIPYVVFAKSYYVSPTGVNSNDGSLAKPFKTITYGISKMSGGDTLYLRTGTYNEKIIISGKAGIKGDPTTLINYNNESVIIDGTGISVGAGSYLVTLNDAYISLVGITIRNVNMGIGAVSWAGSGIIINTNANNCIVSNCTLHDIWASGISILGNSATVEYCTLYNTAMSNSDGIASSGETWGAGISVRGASTHLTQNPYIHHNVIYNCWGEALSFVGADYGIAEDNVIYDFFSVGLYTRNSQYGLFQRNLVYVTKDLGDGDQVGIGHWNEGTLTEHLNSDNIIINNIVYGCRRNFYAILKDLKVAHNTFANSTYVACVQLAGGEEESSSFINNIIIQENTLPAIHINSTKSTFNNNFWSKTPTSLAAGDGDIIDDPRITKKGIIEAGKLTAAYFELLESSQAINKGIVITDVDKDFYNNSRDAKPDMGAHEYIAKITNITVSGADGATSIAAPGKTLQLNASVLPASAANKTITWSIINGTGQASISSSGLVTAIASGTITAKAIANDGSGISGTLKLTISNQTILVTDITIYSTGNATTITTNDGTLQLTAAVLPAAATSKTATWSITNGTGQATISSTGLVTAVANGTVTAKANANDGSGVSGSLVITISNQTIPVTKLSITGAGGATTVTTSGGTLQLSAALSPANANNKTITWSITNGTGQANISSTGLITAIADGTVSATASTTDGSGVTGSLVITIMNQSIINSSPVIRDQQFTILESAFTNNLIGTVIANDIDSKQNLNYTIISGNESGFFSIDPLTGKLTTIDNNLFGPIAVTHELIVKVTDNADAPLSASAKITVNLIGKSTVIYINPDNTNDNLANGSIDHPFDSWDDVAWKEGYTYLQKRSTQTITNKILIGANEVTLGAYGEGESPVISSETNTYLVSVFEKSGTKIRDLNLQASNAVSCIYFLGNSGDSIIIERCKFEAGVNAIKVIDGSTLVIRYNTITSNHEGIYSTAASNEIYYNIFKSCNTAINVVSNSSKANIYNNVFFDNEKSLSVTYAELKLYNNIFYMTSPGQMALNLGTGNIESDFNIYYPEQDGFVAIANTQFDNLEEMQKSLKIDKNSFNTDPIFLDIYNDNFSLGAGSPAINTGIDLMLGIDFTGSLVPSAGATDIGIAEFTGPIILSNKPNEESVMTIYPNPSSGQINILAEIKEGLHSNNQGINQSEVQVIDIFGKTVFHKVVENLNISTIQENIDLSGMSNGLYFVVIHIADEFIKEKLIITK